MNVRIGTAVAAAWEAAAQAEAAAADPPSPEDSDRLAAALLAVADTCRSWTRDGEPEITSAAQFAECARVVGALRAVPVADEVLDRRARLLIEQVERGRAFRWTDPVRAAAVGALGAAVALLGALRGGLDDDVAMVVVASVLGSALLFAAVALARRPAWRVRAESVAPVIRHHGL